MPGLPRGALLRPSRSRGTLHMGGCRAGCVRAIAVTAPCQGQPAKVSQVSILPFLFWSLVPKRGVSEILFVSKERPCVQLKLVSGKPHSRKDELLTKGF